MIEALVVNIFAAVIELAVVLGISRRYGASIRNAKAIILSLSLAFIIFSAIVALVDVPSLVMISVNLALLFGITYAYKLKYYKRLVAVISFYILSMAYEMLIVLIICTITDLSPNALQKNIALYSIAAVISKFLLYFTVKLSLMIIKPNHHTASKWYNVLNLVIPITSFSILLLLSYIVFLSNNSTEKILVLVVAGLLVTANIATFIMYEAAAKRDAKLYEQQAHIVLLQKQKNEYKELIDMQIQSNKEIHDIKYKMYTIREYIQNKDVLASQMVNELCRSIEDKQIVKYTGIQDIDALLNSKMYLAKSKDINLKINIVIDNTVNPDSMDLCVIIGNMLDNSIEYFIKTKDIEKKICLTVKTQKQYVTIKCENTIAAMHHEVELGKTSKDNKSLKHGYGLIKIKELTNKYDGSMKCSQTNDLYSIQLMLKNVFIPNKR